MPENDGISNPKDGCLKTTEVFPGHEINVMFNFNNTVSIILE